MKAIPDTQKIGYVEATGERREVEVDGALTYEYEFKTAQCACHCQDCRAGDPCSYEER